MQHRINFRLGLKLPVTISINRNNCNNKAVYGNTLNLSLTGTFIEIPDADLKDAFGVRNYVDLCLHNPAGEEIRIGGLIIRCDMSGIGVLFNDYNIDTGHHLGKIINLYLEKNLASDSGFQETRAVGAKIHHTSDAISISHH